MTCVFILRGGKGRKCVRKYYVNDHYSWDVMTPSLIQMSIFLKVKYIIWSFKSYRRQARDVCELLFIANALDVIFCLVLSSIETARARVCRPLPRDICLQNVNNAIQLQPHILYRFHGNDGFSTVLPL